MSGVVLPEHMAVHAQRQAQAQAMIEGTLHSAACGIYERLAPQILVATPGGQREDALRRAAQAARAASAILVEEMFGVTLRKRQAGVAETADKAG